jgi:hypothetical protein
MNIYATPSESLDQLADGEAFGALEQQRKPLSVLVVSALGLWA